MIGHNQPPGKRWVEEPNWLYEPDIHKLPDVILSYEQFYSLLKDSVIDTKDNSYKTFTFNIKFDSLWNPCRRYYGKYLDSCNEVKSLYFSKLSAYSEYENVVEALMAPGGKPNRHPYLSFSANDKDSQAKYDLLRSKFRFGLFIIYDDINALNERNVLVAGLYPINIDH